MSWHERPLQSFGITGNREQEAGGEWAHPLRHRHEIGPGKGGSDGKRDLILGNKLASAGWKC